MKRFQGTVSEEKEPQSLVKRFVVVSYAVERVWKGLNEYARVQSTPHVFPVRAKTRVPHLYLYLPLNGMDFQRQAKNFSSCRFFLRNP